MPGPDKKSKAKGKNRVTKDMVDAGTVTGGSAPRRNPDHPANRIPTELLNKVGQGTNHRILKNANGRLIVVDPQGKITYQEGDGTSIGPKPPHPNQVYEQKVMMPAASAGLIKGPGMGSGLVPGASNPGPRMSAARRVKGTPETAQAGNTVRNTDYAPQQDGWARGTSTNIPDEMNQNWRRNGWTRGPHLDYMRAQGGRFVQPQGRPSTNF